jgi:hypothetical protein
MHIFTRLSFFMRRASLLTCLLAGLIASSGGNYAQAQTGPYGDDVSFFIGHLLPNQIEGVTEILPVFGARYAMPTQAGFVEFGLGNTHAYGVDFSTLDVSLRGEFPVGDGVAAFMYTGGTLNWYQPQGATKRELETGFHFGAAGVMLVSDTLWLRSDLRFGVGPGTSLSILFGLVFRSSGR